MNEHGRIRAQVLRIATSTQLALNVHRWGEHAPALLLIHGFGDNARVWDRLAATFAPRGTSIAPDLRGHGDSQWHPLRHYTLDAYAADIEDVVTAACPHDLIAVGHSLGAAVAMQLAARRPSQIRALVLVDASTEADNTGIRHFREEFVTQPWRFASVADYADYLEERRPLASKEMLFSFAHSALRARAQGFELKCDPALKLSLERGDFIAPRTATQLPTCPVLIVRGEASAVLGKTSARQFAQSLQRGSLVSVPMAGHSVLLDNPAGFLAAVQPFLHRELSALTASRRPSQGSNLHVSK